ncbi:MAG TPA: DUF1343 domain-containing protein, partial [Gemmatimonadaceae bacterium]|nr:DUF1343 domain-containing protein [Gemmatimonadaceae bacterium]
FVVLDRPNPITGMYVDGPMLDMGLSNAEQQTRQRSALPYALYPFPLRHGMTMGELALFYNTVLGINAPLHVVPVANWRRSMWFDQTGLPWVGPSPNIAASASALLYPALVPFEGSKLSVGRGTPDAFQRFGAPWLDAVKTAQVLNDRRLAGVHFVVDSFTPRNPGDNKYGGLHIPGIRIDVTDRDRVQPGHIAAAILWAVGRANRDGLDIVIRTFDERFGSSAAREAILNGADPDAEMERLRPTIDKFLRDTRPFRIYP